MSLRTLPALILNLGGEMMYILDQRLHAQNVMEDKTQKVLQEIVGTMFSKHFMDELFRLQPVYSKKAMRAVFDRIAHSSVMRLNAASMDKLYDLMTMGVKYQFLMCLQPKEILFITMNHLEGIMEMVKDNASTFQQVTNISRKFIKMYSELSDGEFQLLRQTALSFFQDIHVRVSIYLKEKIQNADGSFVLSRSGQVAWNTEIPIVIRSFDENGKLVKSISANPGGRYLPSAKGSIEPKGDRGTKLGCNIYSDDNHIVTADGKSKSSLSCRGGPDGTDNSSDANALAQLQLLSRLIGMASTSQKPEIELNLFCSTPEDKDDDENTITPPAIIRDATKPLEIMIDASKKQSSDELNRIMGEMSVEVNPASEVEEDLLDLMDAAH
ncbi:Hypothetical predicted protein [Octopus vulgaris]|uniref:Uncharacterized protein n=2 Tax=Octopus TaxID=6643 RepID=A0AA36BQY4_OCTVU|nr:protein OSCP1-like [Octopus sinensis]CAI9738931.1 Hypothetical predicted protein [Octopus vulgaris]